MSKWTDVRDSIVAELHVNEVTEEVKQRVAATVVREVIPPIEQAVDAFAGKIKEQAREEKGWLYWRDAIVLPALMQGTVWLVRMVLDKTLPQTDTAQG
ncbi:hypothetical protein [uncultured Mitsuokella sp.]|uniref:hypothetical protein n=1 Tax=uncultured Mitsuokella sp. TaxID=453120 RepID=UPI002614CB09|nr:hypothetical protein [uncultured Mitsuokella sp.]